MSHHFDIKFRNKQVAEKARPAFDAVFEQSSKRDGELEAVFCQLTECDLPLLQDEHESKLYLVGSYLPPKWAARIGRVLKAYRSELEKQKEESSDDK